MRPGINIEIKKIKIKIKIKNNKINYYLYSVKSLSDS